MDNKEQGESTERAESSVYDERGIDRRQFLLAASVPAAAALAGCPGTLSQEFSAQPIVLPDAVLGERSYSESSIESITTERSGTVADIEFEATIESHLSVYRPADADQSAEAGELYPDLGAFSTPDAAIQGNSINPLATDSLQSILAGDIVPEVRTQLLTRLTQIEGTDVSWERGPSPIDVQRVLGDQAESGLTGELLDGEVEIAAFSGIASDSDSMAAVIVLLARRIADDVAIASGVLDTALEGDSGDEPIIGEEEGYFGPNAFAGGLSIYVDLLPHYQIQTSNGSTTTTRSPTPTPTPTPTAGSGTVIDDFEDGNSNEYRQLGIVNESYVNSPTTHGSKALQFTNMYGNYGLASTSGLPNYPHQGDQFRAWFQFSNAPSAGHTASFLFGNTAQGGRYEAGFTVSPSGTITVRLRGDGPGNTGSFTANLSGGSWYAFDVTWGPNDITLELLDETTSSLGSATVPNAGDNGDDFVGFKATPNSDAVFWDYAHVVGSARGSYPQIIDDFEDGDISEYSQTGPVTTSIVNSPTKHGSNALEFTDTTLYGIQSPGGSGSSGRLPNYPHLGDQFRAWFRFDGSPRSGNGFTMEFGRDASGATHQAWADKQSSGWNVGLQAVAGGSDSFSATLSSGTWYAFDVSWGPTDIELDLLDASNASLGSATIASNGDNGDDHIKFKADVSAQDSFLWDYAHIVGPSR